ncbi:MAG: helicase-related protein [Desulfitobacteriaceae bacterium]
MNFFLILRMDGGVLFSPFAEGDKPNEQGGALYPALPLSVLQDILRHLRPGREQKAEILEKLSRMPSWMTAKFTWEEVKEHTPVEEGGKDREFGRRVRGRQLTDNDLNRLARELGVSEDWVWRQADNLVRLRQGEWLPAVQRVSSGWRCERCGETEVEEWPSIYGPAVTCPSCAALGPATSLGVLYRDHSSWAERPSTLSADYLFNAHWVLTPAQELASAEVLQFVTRAEEQKGLLWAACGAGKTEVCFPAIDWALRHAIPVLFAAPRQDVVHDVAPRLQKDFRGLEIQILSGRSPHKFTPGPLVLATTHQILRFYQAFGLIFIDEIDAFPYAGSDVLAWGVQQALAPGGKILHLTATPSLDYLQQIRKEQGRLIRLPARHHRKPVPVPKWERMSFSSEVTKCPEDLLLRLREMAGLGTVLVFVPKIAWVASWVRILRRCLPHFTIGGSYSADPERQVKIEDLLQGKYRIFVSTSILERGVTIPGAQVVVLAADHPIFDERALVQMAGRVGRSADQPDGRILFLAGKETRSLKTARIWIEEQNTFARSLGLIDE